MFLLSYFGLLKCFICFLFWDLRNLSRIKYFEKIPKGWEKPIEMETQHVQHYSIKSIVSQKYVCSTRICLCFKSSDFSIFTFLDFLNFQDSTTLICFVKNTLWWANIFWSTILAQIHSCFHVDIGLISMILEILLDASSSFVGARLFQNWQNNWSPDM